MPVTDAMRALAPRQARFVEEYLLDLNASQAATRAGYSKKTCASQGERLLRDPRLQRAIQAAKAARSERTAITAAAVLERFWAIATADPRQLIEYRRTCCRYCHGTAHQYQHTRAELARRRADWEATQKKASKETFDEQGGDGYLATLAPHTSCPECFGEGVERAFVHDTRHLSHAALCLYAGVKVTKDGIEVKMHDQQAALVNVGKHLGMFDEKPEPVDANEIAQRVRAALRAIVDADGLRAA
jgi:phage terminase small subunit